jgi:predicted metalloprotease
MMRWRTGRKSRNIEDLRGSRPTRMSRGLKGGGLGAIVITLVAMYFGVDPSLFLQGMGGGQVTSTQARPKALSAAEKELGQFVSVVLADTEDTWNVLFKQMNRRYVEPKLVLFSGAVQSACGFAQSAMGPFYCPGDHKVYIDLSFYSDLKHRFKAPGDFAQAYVIAHEVGHHIQTLLGVSEKVHKAKRGLGKAAANALSVRQELQADCLAGVWANHANRVRNVIEEGDIEEALNAATAIGDDRLQKQSQGHVTPESFTHGSSEQRVRWFRTGLTDGQVDSCNTFAAKRL